MSAVLGLVRDDLRGVAGYASARREAATGGVWLNANEAASPSLADPAGLARRYPEPQPAALRERLGRASFERSLRYDRGRMIDGYLAAWEGVRRSAGS